MSPPSAADAVGAALISAKLGEDHFQLQPCHSRIPSGLLKPLPALGGEAQGYVAATLITWPDEKSLTPHAIADILTGYAANDDVWNVRFSTVVVVVVTGNSAHPISGIEGDAQHAQSSENQHVPMVIRVSPDDLSLPISKGPIFIAPADGQVFSVLKVVHDDHEAFLLACQPHDQTVSTGERTPLPSHSFQEGGPITVPSRLYYTPTPEKPLAGVRFAVKDIIDIAGLRTGCGNRAWRQLYPIKTETAPAISQILEAGAILIGKTKSTQFAEGQAASEWFDYLSPYNPRGDGYQSASSSSTGSAASIAAYPWLDFTVGSDTGGSIRHPAGVNGSYGSRSSRGAISTKGVYAVTELFDTLGVFTREASMLHSVTKTMLSSDSASIQFPEKNKARYKLLYPVRGKGATEGAAYRWFPLPDEPGPANLAEQEMERTVAKLEDFLGTKRLPLNIDELWDKTRPEGQPVSLDEATGALYSTITTYTPVRAAIDPFIADYEAQFHRKPFIDPIVRQRQGIGRETSDAEYAKAVEAVKMFKSWILDVLLTTKNSDNGDADEEEVTPILIFPQAFGRPEYRDTHPDPHAAPLYSSFSIYSISYVSGCPDYTIPIGDVPYESRIEGGEAFLPVALSILSRPGTDAALSGLVEGLEKAGVVRPVRTGRRMYVDEK